MPRLHYYVRNGGDGSASPRFFASAKEAEEREERDLKEFGEAWGEPSAGSVELKVEDGKIFFQKYDDNYEPVWIEVR